jgi:hypothetical protein
MFLGVSPCSVLNIYRSNGGTRCLRLTGRRKWGCLQYTHPPTKITRNNYPDDNVQTFLGQPLLTSSEFCGTGISRLITSRYGWRSMGLKTVCVSMINVSKILPRKKKKIKLSL